MQLKRWEVSLIASLLLAALLPGLRFYAGCRALQEDVVRLHVLANSDSAADQAVKLLVRDALLESGAALFSGTANQENAARLLQAGKAQLEARANAVLRQNGMPYTAKLCLTKEFFTTRSYQGFTMPAGQYTAVKVILGAGQGHNWWCVMYPPLCLPAATDTERAGFSASESAVLYANDQYEVRFKLVEWFETLKEKVRTHAGTHEF